MSQHPKGLLVVVDPKTGIEEVFEGRLFGAVSDQTQLFGEVVFNTSMTGYQEVMTDPSYAGQIICFTVAHIGNTGANKVDFESTKMYAEAVVIAGYTAEPSNFRSEESLEQFLITQKKIGIYDVDTRALTLFLRDRGVTPGFIIRESERAKIADYKKQLQAKDYGSIDWILRVSTKEPYWLRAETFKVKAKYKVVAYDYGVKQQLLRDLAIRSCDIYVVPADYPAEKVLAEKPDGVFLSNGPGDPSLATYAVKNVQEILGKRPLFGVCMGHQILGLAVGAKTYKLKFGHRGGNQPVKNLANQSVEISSHNHGYAVDAKTLPKNTILSHINLNDECCEGIMIDSLKAFSVQYHPESSPGPHDSSYLFDQFITLMNSAKN